MTNQEVYETIKDKFAGVLDMTTTTITLGTTDGQTFEVDQKSFESEYHIMFFCGGREGSCGDCDQHGSEKWGLEKREAGTPTEAI